MSLAYIPTWTIILGILHQLNAIFNWSKGAKKLIAYPSENQTPTCRQDRLKMTVLCSVAAAT